MALDHHRRLGQEHTKYIKKKEQDTGVLQPSVRHLSAESFQRKLLEIKKCSPQPPHNCVFFLELPAHISWVLFSVVL